MSMHSSKTAHLKNKKAEKGKFNFRSLFTDLEADSEGYDLKFTSILPMVLAVLLFAAGKILNAGSYVRLALNLAAVLVSAIDILKNLFMNLQNRRFFSESLLVILSILCAALTKSFFFALLIAVFYTILKLIENIIAKKSHERAYQVLKILPDSTHVVEEGELFTRKAIHIQAGDILKINKNDIVPVNGRVIDGISAIDYSPLTRNSRNIAVTAGSQIVAGGINMDETILLEATDDYANSMAQQIFTSFNKTMRREGKEEKLLNQIFNYFTPAMVLIFLVVAVIVPVIKGEWNSGLFTGLILLLLACPLGITSSISLVYYNAVEKIFSAGAIIKDSSIVSRVAAAETFICNKTAVLTEKEYVITEVKPVGIPEDKLFSIINAVEAESNHPIAQAIRYYSGSALEHNADTVITEIPGKGLSARTGENTIYVGNAVLLYDHDIECEIPEGGGSAVHVAVNGNYCGYVLLENRLRADIYNPLEKLRANGIQNLVLLSSDLRSIVRPIAGSLNFDTVKAEISREGKNSSVEYIEANRNKGSYVIYAGNSPDEIETASRADICVSLDVLQNEDVLNRSDISILDESIYSLPNIVAYSRKALTCVRTDMIVSLAARIIAILLLLTIKSAVIPSILLLAAAFFVVLDQPDLMPEKNAGKKSKPVKSKKVRTKK